MLKGGGWVLQIAVGRSPPLGYRRLDDAPPAREGTREIKRSESPPSPSPPGLMIKWIIGITGCPFEFAIDSHAAMRGCKIKSGAVGLVETALAVTLAQRRRP
jgi:hypothetical protein